MQYITETDSSEGSGLEAESTMTDAAEPTHPETSGTGESKLADSIRTQAVTEESRPNTGA